MSASEKLRVLLAETTQKWPEGQAESQCIDCLTPVPSVAVQIMPALPQLLAVVEAAEIAVALSESAQIGWGEAIPRDVRNGMARIVNDGRAALAALCDSLEGSRD